MNVIDVPATLEAGTFDQLVAQIDGAHEGKVLFDARHLRWVDPYGMVGLLAAGQVIRDRTGVRSRMQLSDGADTTGYLARMGFFENAEQLFDFDVRPPRRSGRDSDVLLEITPITTNSDIHTVVDRVQGRAGAILSRTLGYPTSAVVQRDSLGGVSEHHRAR